MYKTGFQGLFRAAGLLQLFGSWQLPTYCWEISKKFRGITFQTLRRTSFLTRAAETYIDDTELILDLDIREIHTLAQEMQAIAQYWEQLLYTTGGALALEKCFYVAMDWKIINDEYIQKRQEELLLTIQLTSGGNINH